MAIKKYTLKTAPPVQETMTGKGIKNSLQADLIQAITDYLVEYCLPSIPAKNIFYGNQNDISLPKENDYIIFSYLSSVRHGTNTVSWEPKESNFIELEETVEFLFQVDFFADTSNGKSGMSAMQRAQTIEAISRSSFGVDFFNKYGLSLLYADEPRDLTFIGDSDAYVRRASLTLHISSNVKISLIQDFFNNLALDLKEVDTFYH